MAMPIAAGLCAEKGVRSLRTSRIGLAILVLGVMLTIVATVIAFREAGREERMLWQGDTAPIRSAVEREITQYSALQTVAQLATDPLANDSSDGVKTLQRIDAIATGVSRQRLANAASQRNHLE